jgi:glyoxylase-like metal-dependent hydrolase (beta-lactamase superfamily II)
MGAVIDLSERFWRGEVRGPELVRASGAVEEIAPDVLFVHAFANVTALRTADGLVLVDTGNYRARDKTFAAVRAWDARPLATAVYTHGHVDHACGLPPFLDEAQRHGWPRPRIVGHRDVAVERADQRAAVLDPALVADGVRLSRHDLRRHAPARDRRDRARAHARAR